MADTPAPRAHDDEDGPELDPATDAAEAVDPVESPEEWVAPTREEWQRTQKALEKANAEAKKHRLAMKEAAQKAQDGGDEAAKAAQDAERRFKPVAIRSAAKAAFLEAGLADATDARVRKLMRMVDVDEVDIDDDGDVTGLDEQITAIRADYPELFRKAERPARERAPRLSAAGREGRAEAPKSTGDRIAAQVMGR